MPCSCRYTKDCWNAVILYYIVVLLQRSQHREVCSLPEFYCIFTHHNCKQASSNSPLLNSSVLHVIKSPSRLTPILYMVLAKTKKVYRNHDVISNSCTVNSVSISRNTNTSSFHLLIRRIVNSTRTSRQRSQTCIGKEYSLFRLTS